MTAAEDGLRAALAEALAVHHGYDADDVLRYTTWIEQADALLPTVRAAMDQRAAEALEAAYVEDRTTVAKLSPIERLTCFLVKSEDLVTRIAALRDRAAGNDRGQG